MVGLQICLLGRQKFGCTDRRVWIIGGSVTWEKRTFDDGPVNGGGCGPWLVFWFHCYTLATEEEHGHLRDGFWKAVPEFVLSNRPPFSTGSLDLHVECQFLSSNGSDEFGQPSASQIPHIAQKLVPSLSHLNRSFKMQFIVTPPYATLLMFFFPSFIGFSFCSYYVV